MSTLRRKILREGPWCWRRRWRSCVAVLSDQLSVFRKRIKSRLHFAHECSSRLNEWRPEEKAESRRTPKGFLVDHNRVTPYVFCKCSI
jgi:hypothetical protein